MPTTRKRGAAVAVATLGLLLNGALAGCSLSKDDDKRDTSSASRADADPDGDRRARPRLPSPAHTDADGDQPGHRDARHPAAALLGAAELPPLNASSPWTEKGTTVPGPHASFGVCQQFDAAVHRRR